MLTVRLPFFKARLLLSAFAALVVSVGVQSATSERLPNTLEAGLAHLSCLDLYDAVIFAEKQTLQLETSEHERASVAFPRKLLKREIVARLNSNASSGSSVKVDLLVNLFSKIHKILNVQVPREFRALSKQQARTFEQTFDQWLEADLDSSELSTLGGLLFEAQNLAQGLAIECEDTSASRQLDAQIKYAFPTAAQEFQADANWYDPIHDGQYPVESTPANPAPALHRLVRGGYNVFTNLYQRCDVLQSSPLDFAVSVQGILIVGHHPDGVGNRRQIDKKDGLPVPAFFLSHPYLRDLAPPRFDLSQSSPDLGAASECADIKSSPPIYDYGGKPFVQANALDFRHNNGSGTDVLGVDCSGFVMSSLLASGSRLKKNIAIDSSELLLNYGARAMRSPAEYGLSCLSPFTIQKVGSVLQTIQSGDILAETGHVVLLEWTSDDPFNLAGTRSLEDCVAARFDPKTFNLRILHSSSNNNGIGLARHTPAGFVRDNFNAAFKELAVMSCKAKYQAGYSAASVLASGINVVRFTNAEGCTEAPKSLSYSSCVSQCHF